jgi:undecaprenyl diphosphate synthase
MSQTDSTVPTHVGLILDGNRRWARERNLPTLEGHRQGFEHLKAVAEHAFDKGVKYLSAYIFSTENWSRTQEEVSYLMNLVIKMMDKYLDEVHEKGIKIVILGREDGLRQDVLKAIRRAEEKTRHNTRGTLALCFNYGGHDEIVDATRQIVSQGIPPEQITRETVAAALYGPEVPGVDLIIRTSGEQRLSGFMLYRSDYAELYFSNKYWPDFTSDDFDEALADYAGRKRRFGK